MRRHGWPITIVFVLLGAITLVIGSASVVLTIWLAIALAIQNPETPGAWFARLLGLLLLIAIVCGMVIAVVGISRGMVKLVKGD